MARDQSMREYQPAYKYTDDAVSWRLRHSLRAALYAGLWARAAAVMGCTGNAGKSNEDLRGALDEVPAPVKRTNGGRGAPWGLRFQGQDGKE